MKIIVLNDGETWDTLEGCTMWEITDEGEKVLALDGIEGLEEHDIISEEYVEAMHRLSQWVGASGWLQRKSEEE